MIDTPSKAVARARAELRRLSRPAVNFDPARYFRSDVTLVFHNVGTPRVRSLARAVYNEHSSSWRLSEALAFADALMTDPHLEAKLLGIELLARYRREFTSRLLPVWKRWLTRGHSSNWATTDAICTYLIGPLLAGHPRLAKRMPLWARHQNPWVRRASAVSLVGLARKGVDLDLTYEVAWRLHGNREDLIQKAVGWLLREAGKADSRRLETYLRAHGPTIPRTTVRYAIERMPEARRRAMLEATK
jgi:3-methyladenine DNA glycosylase AlkD